MRVLVSTLLSLWLPVQVAFADEDLAEKRMRVAKTIMLELNAGARDVTQVPEFYVDDVVYVDPLVKISGVAPMQNYFDNLNKISNEFTMELLNVFVQGDDYMMYWKAEVSFDMGWFYKPQNLTYDGVSLLRFKPESARVWFQQDFYDHSNVLEFMPVVGPQVRFAKKQMIKVMMKDEQAD